MIPGCTWAASRKALHFLSVKEVKLTMLHLLPPCVWEQSRGAEESGGAPIYS